MSWSRAVWYEGKKEFEDVVPSKWIQERNGERVLLWPPHGQNEKHFLDERKEPEESWRCYKLKKVKTSNGEFILSVK